jgi:hypothetical protein
MAKNAGHGINIAVPTTPVPKQSISLPPTYRSYWPFCQSAGALYELPAEYGRPSATERR